MNVTTDGPEHGQSGTSAISSVQTSSSTRPEQKCSETSPSSPLHSSHIQCQPSNLIIGTVSYSVGQQRTFANGGRPGLALSSSVQQLSLHQDSRQPKFDAFFIDLASPVSIKPLSAVPSLNSQVKLNGWEQATIDEHESSDVAQFRMSARLLQAAVNRLSLLHERKRKLRLRSELIKRKVMLQRHRDRLFSLKCKARVDFAQSSAAIKRHMFLQERTEYFGAMVQRAHRVAILRRLDRSIQLRKSVSVSFAELISDNVSLTAYLEADDLGKDQTPGNENQTPVSSTSRYSPRSPISPSVASKLMNRSPTTNSPASSTVIFLHPIHTEKNTPDDPTHTQSHSPIPKSASMPQLSSALRQYNTPADKNNLDPNATVAIKPPISVVEQGAYAPPITRHTLRELDVTEILSNAQLRHDLLFDPDMQYRPNVEGERGLQRESLSDVYWAEIKIEIEEAERGHRPWIRIPLLIQEIKEIVKELIPGNVEFASTLNEIMDIDLITQALNKTRSLTSSAGRLVEYLADHMHQYCAPCRDPLIDKMVELFQGGQLTAGLKMCLEVLELMKLDFANHHLKKLRPWIVENSVEFEWRYFKERFEAKIVTIESTENWLRKALDERHGVPPRNVYNAALVKLIVDDEISNHTGPSKPPLPETMWMDTSRISGYHNEYQDLSIMATLLTLFKQSCGRTAFAHLPLGEVHPGLIETKKTLWTLLNHVNTTMAHVATQLVTEAGKIRGHKFSNAEMNTLHRLVDTTLTFDHPLFMLFQRRVAESMVKYLDQNGRLGSHEELARTGLLDVGDELNELGRKIKLFADHNRATYRVLYDSIIEEWKKN